MTPLQNYLKQKTEEKNRSNGKEQMEALRKAREEGKFENVWIS